MKTGCHVLAQHVRQTEALSEGLHTPGLLMHVLMSFPPAHVQDRSCLPLLGSALPELQPGSFILSNLPCPFLARRLPRC